ncbi:VOC family protein [Nocardia terpenica]|uniref:VOC family protein n=1 Tax=Nocardia terpenica TaxID=455432 RepID=A0A6G9Z6Y9_9NOCA|nr:VOC family protein [Nocardia terpenica]QIS21117.1 VOC family protein [Nocardia terpenica]
MVSVKQFQVTFDCAEPERVVRFWCEVLGYIPLHLDVRVGTGLVGEERLAVLEAECARLVALGAVRVRLLPADGDNESCLVMQDIEGNEFCLD